jgi:predicted dehydrogenase
MDVQISKNRDGERVVTLRVIHAGLGGWGTNWEQVPIPKIRDVERVAIVEPFEAPLRAAQELLGLPDAMCITDLDQALAEVEADAVIATVPMFAHVPVTLTALRAGKHVLVEKPFAGTVAEAKKAVDLAAEKGLILQVSQNYRFYPAARTATRLVQEQVFGPVNTVRVDFRKYDNTAPFEGHRHYVFEHPLIYDMAIHHFDLMRLVLGCEAVSVYAQVTDPEWSKFRDEAAATIVVTMGNGVVVSYRGSWVSTGEPTVWAGDWHVECKDGEIHWTGRGNNDTTADDRVWTLPLGSKREKKVELDSVGIHGRAGGLQAFVNAIKSGEEPETSGYRNLGSVAMMEAAAKSAASGNPEPVINPYI